MSSRISNVALAGAFAASAAFGQVLVPEQVPVKRPDGSIVYPATAGSAQSAPEAAAAMRPDGTVVRPNAAGIPGSAPDPVPVRRPDGTVVLPSPPQRAPSISTTDSRADERERMRQQAQQAAEERIDQSRREREAASTSPARQSGPTMVPR